MISQLNGVVVEKEPGLITIMIGGVGLNVFTTRTTDEKASIDQELTVLTRLIVREDSLTLFGFSSEQERDLFDTLIKISGVGPKLAITILSTLSVDNLRTAVINDRVELITRVPGIGKKTAQKILLELKDKVPVGLEAIPGSDAFSDVNSDVMDALVSLGFSVIEAQSAIQSLPPDASEDVQERIMLALQQLSN